MADQASDSPILDLLATMNRAGIEASKLDPQSLMLVRLAALVAVDAPPVSYMLNLEMAGEVDLDSEQVEDCSPRSHRSWALPASRPRRGRWSERSGSRSASRSSTRPEPRALPGCPSTRGSRSGGAEGGSLEPVARVQ